MPGWLAGLAVASALGVGHLAFVLTRQRGSNEDVASQAVSQVARLMSELDGLREDLSALREEFDALPDTNAVVSELKLLQGLLTQLHSKRGDPKSPGTSPGKPPGKSPEKSPGADVVVAKAAETSAATQAPMVLYDDEELLVMVEHALRDDQVQLYLQPTVSLPQRQRIYYECFSRIELDDGSIVTPEQFLPVAEHAGHVSGIDNMLLFRCVQLIRRARRDHLDVGFFYNISPYSLKDVDFFQDFIEFMAANRQLAESLIFEFDQKTVANPSYETQMNMRRLMDLGYRFSLDQVTNLDLDLPALAGLGFRFVKLNAHLVHEMARGDNPRLNMEAFKGALDRAAMDLIVEKIENEDMLVDLLELKINVGQGFLFGEPRPSVRTD